MSTEAHLAESSPREKNQEVKNSIEFSFAATPENKDFSDNLGLDIRKLLDTDYRKRAVLTGFLLTHKMPLHDVSFTIVDHDPKQERERLKAKRQKEEKKEIKVAELKKPLPEKEGSEQIVELDSATPLEKTIAVKEIFTPTAQLQTKGLSPEEKSHSKPVHRVLILGPPGSGKTTLSKHLMTEWLEKRALTQHENAFWITARDLNNKEKYELLKKCADSSYPLAALIHQLCLDEAAQEQIGIKALDALLKNSKTLVLLDGFDEVAHYLSDETEAGKPLKKLLLAILNTSADLLVTSREYSIPPSNIPFDRQLINRGFTDAQVESYVERYFSRLSKPEGKSGEKSGEKNEFNLTRKLKKNARLWNHAHNPLILNLVCDYYELQRKNREVQTDINLLDLYDRTLEVFLRRYLDLQNKAKKAAELSWEETENFSLDALFEKCSVEMDFLQTLSFKGMEEGRQLFDRTLKEAAFEEVCTRHKNISEIPVRNALKLGFLHEFSGPQVSSLDKTHEFLHLTFQEYLAARYIAKRLKLYDRKMYQWLRENKYNPSYRMTLNFLCQKMPANKYPEFWKVLLGEKTDIVGSGHLQLMMHSLEAVGWDASIPGLKKYLNAVEQSLIQCIKTKKFEKITWIQDALRQCPQLVGHLSNGFWDIIGSLLQSKENDMREQSLIFLLEMAIHADQLSRERQAYCLRALFKALGDDAWGVKEVAAQAFSSYVAQARQFPGAGRSWALKALRKATHHPYTSVKKSAVLALVSYSAQIWQLSLAERSEVFEALFEAAEDRVVNGRYYDVVTVQPTQQFLLAERIQLFEALLKAANNKEEGAIKCVAVWALDACAAQAWKFSLAERSQIFEALLKAIGSRKGSGTRWALDACTAQAWQFSPVERSQLLNALLKMIDDKASVDMRCAVITAVGAYASQAGQFSAVERSLLLEALLKVVVDKDWSVRKAVVQALGACASQAGQFSAGERSLLLEALLKVIAHAHDHGSWGTAITALGACAPQAGQFSAVERSLLLEALLEGVRAGFFGVEDAAVRALGACGAQPKQFSREERSQVLEALLKLVGYRCTSLEALASYYAIQVGEFSAEERSRVLKVLLLEVADSKYQYGRGAAVKALGACAAQPKKFSREERSQVLEALLKAAGNKDEYTRKAAYPALANCLFHSQDWLGISYVESYSVLNQMLADHHFLPTLPANELLHAYFVDEANWALGSYPRRELWLQFLIARLHTESASILIYEDHCKLYSVKSSKPSIVSIPSNKGAELVKKLKKALNAREMAAPLEGYSDTPITLPIETPAKISSESSFLEDLVRVVEKQGQDKAEIKAEFKAEIQGMESRIDARMETYEQRLQTVENNVVQLQVQVKAHDNIFTEHQKALSGLQENAIAMQQNMETFIKQEIKIQSDALEAQQERLEKVMQAFDITTQALQKSQNQMELALEKIGTEIGALQTQDVHTLEALTTLQKSEARQKTMLEAYEAMQKQLKDRETLLSNPKYAEFYRTMYIKLSGFFMACTVASTGLIKLESPGSFSDKVAQKIVGILGENIPIPGAKAASDFINSMIAWNREHEAEAGRERVGASAPISFGEKENAIDLTIQEIIHRYGEHIKMLKKESVKDFAECAVNRIAHGIQQEKPLGDPKDFPQYMVNLLHQVKLKQGKLGHKALETESGVIPKGKKPWTEDGIFRRTGIQSDLRYYYSDQTEASLISSKPLCRHEKYGFRSIPDDKQASLIANTLGFEKHSTLLPVGSFQCSSRLISTQTAPQGPISMFGKSKQAAAAVAKDKIQNLTMSLSEGVPEDLGGAFGVVRSGVNLLESTLQSAASNIVQKVG